MSNIKLEVSPRGDSPQETMSTIIDPEISRFSEYFSKVAGGGHLNRFEREILRAYLWWKLEVDREAR